MQELYSILFKILLFMPFLGVLNTIFLNNFFKIQKTINNILYLSLSLISFAVLIFFSIYGKYEINILNLSKDIPLIFSATSVNLVFSFIITSSIFFFNMTFQNYFVNLNLSDKYVLYNRQMAYLVFFYILFIFCNNILAAIFIYILIIVYSFLLLSNPDLKELRQKYSMIFSSNIIISTILILITSFYFVLSKNILFNFIDISKFDNIFLYIIIILSLFMIVGYNFIYPIYRAFKEKFYYEDLLPMFISYSFPFLFLNTFFFIKICYFLLNSIFNNLTFYFYYFGFFVPLLFFISCFFLIKHLKNSLKFIIIFSINNFLTFFSHILFASSDLELIKSFSIFNLLILSIVLLMITYSGILFLLLKLKSVEIKKIYKKHKLEINFYFFTLFLPIYVNIYSFFTLNFYNFNLLYLINIFQIILSIIISILYLYINLKNYKKEEIELEDISSSEKIKFFTPQITFLFYFLFFALLRSQIYKFIIFYK